MNKTFEVVYSNKDSEANGETFLVREDPSYPHHYLQADGKHDTGDGRLLKKYCIRKTKQEHSQLPWRKIVFDDGVSFIQADRNHAYQPYDIEVFGDDVNPNLYPQEQKDADIDLTLFMVNNASLIKELLEKASFFFDERDRSKRDSIVSEITKLLNESKS